MSRAPAPAAARCFVYILGSRRGGDCRTYVGWTLDLERREAKSRLCRLTEPREIEAALTSLWRQDMALAA